MLFPYLGLTKKKAWQAENPKGRSRQKLRQIKKKNIIIRELCDDLIFCQEGAQATVYWFDHNFPKPPFAH